MSEINAYNWLRDRVIRSPNRIDRIENLVVNGMPDVNAKICGCEEFWLEIKAPREPKRATTALIGGSNHPLSQDQKNWFLRQRRAGGRAFIWVETDKRRMLIPGIYADRFNEMTLAELTEAAIWLGMKNETTNYQELLQCFKRQTT